MAEVSLTVRSPQPKTALLVDGNASSYDKHHHAHGTPQKRKCFSCRAFLCTILILSVLVGEALLIFFLIPRDPCIYMKSGSGQVSSFTAAPPSFTVTMDVDLSWGNPSYVSLGFQNLHLDIYHACCTNPIGTVDSLPSVEVPARSSKDVTVSISLNSSQMPNSAACASELAVSNRCLLSFRGTAEPIYTGYALPAVPVQFQQYITR